MLLFLAVATLLGAAPVPAPRQAAIVTCADGARLYLWGARAIPLRTSDSAPVGAQLRILAGPRNPDHIGTYYEVDVPTLHREGDGDFFWVSDACITITQ